MNELLAQQLKKSFGEGFNKDDLSNEFKDFITQVEASYTDFTQENVLLDNTLNNLYKEVSEANRNVIERNNDLYDLLQKRSNDLTVQTKEADKAFNLLKQYQKAIDSSLIVTITDPEGVITYVNQNFCKISGYSLDETINHSHNLIRHPDMPRVIFKLLWDTLRQEEEIFAYVKNRSKTGRYYWVLAHVTPSYDQNHKLNGYHSNRRCPDRHWVEEISKLYQTLLNEEAKHQNPDEGIKASASLLAQILDEAGHSYPEFVWSTMRSL